MNSERHTITEVFFFSLRDLTALHHRARAEARRRPTAPALSCACGHERIRPHRKTRRNAAIFIRWGPVLRAPYASLMRRRCVYRACWRSVCTRQALPARAHSAAFPWNGLRTTTRRRSSATSQRRARRRLRRRRRRRSPTPRAGAAAQPPPVDETEQDIHEGEPGCPGTSGAISAPVASSSSDGVASGAMPT